MALAKKLQTHFIYADYAQWPEDERWELIDGVAYAMAAPQRMHQKVVVQVSAQITQYLSGKPCEPYIAPFDVRLPQRNEMDDQVDTVVQPDILVVCDKSKLDDKGCRGAPDWVIEVLSPSTAFKDMDTKRELYQRHRIKEYWIVHPIDQWIMAYTLDEHGEYGKGKVFNMLQSTPVGLFPELLLDWAFMVETDATQLF